MSRLLTVLVFCSVVLCTVPAKTQSCCGNHLTEQFNNHDIVDTVYATNRVLFNGLSTNLSLRIWNAQDNPCTKKPLIVFLHGGGFIQGDNQLMDSLCRAFSACGFLAASVQYRLGWFGEQYCSADSAEAIRAWYRAVADCREAIFFLKNQHAWLGIDTNLVFLSGWSAGGYIAAGTAFLDQAQEKPFQCDSLPPLEWPPGNLQFRADLGGMPDPLRSLDIKGIITFSSSMLFPSLLVDQLLPIPVLAFNNQLDPYEVPIDQLAPWWSINACAAFYPHAAGWSSPEVSNFMDSGSIQHVIYNEASCAHNMHHPCFPFWQKEIETMSQFMQDRMECELPLINPNPNFSMTKQVLVCRGESQLMEILVSRTNARLMSLSGVEVTALVADKSELHEGFYFLHSSGSVERIIFIK
jgi:pimeloyl-ACP methyl ester carboxylesterase